MTMTNVLDFRKIESVVNDTYIAIYKDGRMFLVYVDKIKNIIQSWIVDNQHNLLGKQKHRNIEEATRYCNSLAIYW